MTVTFLDSGVLIAAARGDVAQSRLALAVLDDADRAFVSSDFVRLEVLPKPIYHRRQPEVDFYLTFFDAVSHWVGASPGLTERALDYAYRFGLGACDALHIAAADIAGAGELITIEKPDKPIFRVPRPRVTSLRSTA